MTCETYHFELRRAPTFRPTIRPTEPTDLYPGGIGLHKTISGIGAIGGYLSGLGQGEFWDRFLACYTEIATAIPKRPAERTVQNMYSWCCQVKAAIQDLIATHGSHDCNLDEALAHMVCPPPAEMPQDQYFQLIQAHVTVMLGIAARLLKACLCSILLPPCPEPAEDNCVAIATVTVRRSDCHIIRVCNFENRDMVITLQTLRYWLSAFPFEERFMQGLAELCCDDETRKPPKQVTDFEIPSPSEYGYMRRMFASRAAGAETGRAGDPFANLFADVTGRRDEPLDMHDLLLDAMGARGPEGRPFVSESERTFPLQATLLNRVFMPALGGMPGAPPPRPGTGDLDEMRSALNTLREEVTRQAAEIERLRRQG
jgi:hypothetical protein